MRRQPRGPSAPAAAARPAGGQSAEEAATGLSQTVTKALSIIELVGLERKGTLAELAASTGLPRSTLHRLVGTLVEQGFLQRAAHGRYRVSLKLWRIGATAVDLDAVRENARAVLTELVNSTSETAHYSVYEDGFAVYVEKVDGLHPIRAYTAVGGRSPSHASATGKALLAWQNEDEIRRVAGAAEGFTAATLVGDRILAEMAVVRRQGFAVNRGEWRQGVWGIAAPLFGPSGTVLAAVGISGPEHRIDGAIERLSGAVLAAARELSQHPPAALPAPLRRATGGAR